MSKRESVRSAQHQLNRVFLVETTKKASTSKPERRQSSFTMSFFSRPLAAQSRVVPLASGVSKGAR